MGLLENSYRGRIVNLTNEPVWAYSSSGEIVCLEPSWYQEADYYLVGKNSDLEWENLVIVERCDKGRDDVVVSSLVLKNDPKTRIYPCGE